ncbi:hypothetical protein [Sulfurimonas sp.]
MKKYLFLLVLVISASFATPANVLYDNTQRWDLTFDNPDENLAVQKIVVEVAKVAKEVDAILAQIPRIVKLGSCSDTGCNLDAAKCNAIYEDPICPSDSILNTTRDMCQKDPDVKNCPSGFDYDQTVDKCVKSVVCPSGGTYVVDRQRCEYNRIYECPDGYTEDANGICIAPPTCPDGATFDETRNRCESPIGYTCEDGWILNNSTLMCETNPTCPDGIYNNSLDKCELDYIKTCPDGYTLNSSGDRCETNPTCPDGTTYNSTSNRCEKDIYCPDGFSWDATINACTGNATCDSPSTLNTTTNRCEYTTSENDCPAGTTLDSASNLCVATPTCDSPGTYDNDKNLCVVTTVDKTCPEDYTYSDTYATCISNPICSYGIYNSTNNQCEATPTTSCETGYTYNSATDRCEKDPYCSSGTYSNALNKCVISASTSCETGYTYNSTTDRCETNPTCPNGTTYNTNTNKCEGDSACESGTWDGSSCESTSSYPASIDGTIKKASCTTSYNGSVSCSWSDITDGVTFGTYNSNYGNTLLAAEGQVDKIATGETDSRDNPIYALANFYINGFAYACPNGGTLSGETCYQTTTSSPSCPTDYSINDSGICYTNPTCLDGGSYDGDSDVCYKTLTITCPSGFTYDSTNSVCVADAYCSYSGTLSTSDDKCYLSKDTSCPTGYSLSGSICIKVPTCSSGGSYASSIDQCTYEASYSCSTGYNYNSTYNVCTATAICVTGTILNNSTDQCEVSGGWTCYSGFTASGNICYQDPNCSLGTYDENGDECNAGSETSCTGLTLDADSDKCYTSSSCYDNGYYDYDSDKCWFSYSPTCSSGVYSSEDDKCLLDADCNGGTLNTATDKCEIDHGYSCPDGGTEDLSNQVCIFDTICYEGGSQNGSNCEVDKIPLECPTDANSGTDTTLDVCYSHTNDCLITTTYPDYNTLSYSDTLQACLVKTDLQCAEGLSWSAEYQKCEAIPICSEGVYYPANDKCFNEDYSCPTDPNLPCIGPSMNKWCSPWKCNANNQCGYAYCLNNSPSSTEPWMARDLLYNIQYIANNQCIGNKCDVVNNRDISYCGGEETCPKGFGVYEVDGKCYVDACPDGSEIGDDGNCYEYQCPSGTTEQGDGSCL